MNKKNFYIPPKATRIQVGRVLMAQASGEGPGMIENPDGNPDLENGDFDDEEKYPQP